MPRSARRSVPNAVPHRFLLRLPRDLHRWLADGAQQAGVSLNEFCVQRLGRMTAGGEADAGPAVAHARQLVGPSLVGVLVHGSWARGESRATSDVDLLVVIDRDVPLARALYTTWDQAAPSFDGRPIDVHFVHPPLDPQQPGAVWCEAALDGLVIADRDGAVVRALYEVRRAIAEGRIVRRRLHGQSYWTTASEEDEIRNRDLAADHVRRAQARLRALDTLFEAQSWADVVREVQEIVELALTGLLRASGVEPPRLHDVAGVLHAERQRLPAPVAVHLDRLAEISRTLRRDRELAFYGAEDLTPSDFYKQGDAVTARDSARFVVSTVAGHVRTDR